MKIDIHHRCSDFQSYRAARVKSLFNVESGANWSRLENLPVEDHPWQIGVIVGPSGSGKTSMGRAFGAEWKPLWPERKPIIDAIAPTGDFDQVTGALSAVGLGSVPAWLRPYHVLSGGERFRADLARLVCERPSIAVMDEFTSVVDRQIARIGSGAFAKAWRRGPGQVVLLTPHYDVLEWLQPDWVFDTASGQYERGCLRRRPPIDVDIWQTGWEHWPAFEPHHYLKLPKMIAATNYVATVEGELVAHVAFSTRPGLVEARACRLVVMPEWQGAGVGMRFLNTVCAMWAAGQNRYAKPMPTLFHTSHPGLCAALRRDPAWTQVSGSLHGDNRQRCVESMKASVAKGLMAASGAGYGGHFRAVQGFRYLLETDR